MTYTAFLALAILRDDFSRLDRPGIIRFLRTCQREDGRYWDYFPYQPLPHSLFFTIVSQPYLEATSLTCARCIALSRLAACSTIGPG